MNLLHEFEILGKSAYISGFGFQYCIVVQPCGLAADGPDVWELASRRLGQLSWTSGVLFCSGFDSAISLCIYVKFLFPADSNILRLQRF